MTSLSNEEINKIRNSVNIVDVVRNYVNLEKRGKNYFGICPFHDDHNPSMSVSEDKQIFTCFVCGSSGNVCSFIQNYENISFLEAVNRIASMSGISLSRNINVVKKYDKEYKIYDLALKYYKNNIKSEYGIKARKYLNDRNINEDIINEFDIGVSLNDNALSKLLISKKYDEKILVDIGLSNKNEDRIYDVFRNRIMFPIHNSNGDVVGFSGRIYNNEADSKYINTRETYIFKKGEILFNYHRAINEAKKNKYLIICEGQMDAIRIYSSGIKNVVATMGTALTKEHIKLIHKLNVRVVLNMDSDSAGIKATLQNGELLSNDNIDVSVIKLSGAKDPDEYISKFGIDSYKDSIKHAVSLFDFKLNNIKNSKNLEKADELSLYVNEVIEELNKSNDEVLRNITINKLSSEYNIDKNILLNKLNKIDDKKDVVIVKKKVIKLKQNIKAIEEILFYMMNSIKYAKIFEQELNYVPDKKYFNIEKDIQAYIIINNTINLADFISYETEKGNKDIISEIINNHNDDVEMNENEFRSYIKIIEKWIKEDKINELKLRIKSELDINKKKELMDMIASIKRGSEL